MRLIMDGDTKLKPVTQEVGFTDLLSRLASDSAILIREEAELAKQEVRERIQAAKAGAIMIAAGAILGTIGLLTVWTAFIIWLGFFWPPIIVALVAGAGLALIGAILVFVASRHFEKTTATPVRSVEALQGRTGNG
jgi:ABC-type Fe3+-siderophore transport system permease subunit